MNIPYRTRSQSRRTFVKGAAATAAGAAAWAGYLRDTSVIAAQASAISSAVDALSSPGTGAGPSFWEKLSTFQSSSAQRS